MEITNAVTLHTHIIDIEHEGTTYSVTFADNDWGHDITVLNVDTLDEIDPQSELYNLLVEFAEQSL